jgi:hypothetical protein
MKIIILLLICISLLTTSAATADTILRLKDGSILKGRVIQMAHGVYSVQTAIGQVEIGEDQIVSISEELDQPIQPSSTTSVPADSNNLRTQVQNVQGSLMNDAQLMADIQMLAQDPEIMPLLMDPSFMKDMLSYDPQRIQSNPKLETLMSNPKMKALLEKIAQKLAVSQASNP